uniref:PNPLA domain-containing protein n=1 Tax=viral metagenome TaxID=1070528 RepID=A0A6C0D9J8_9ZZZZ
MAFDTLCFSSGGIQGLSFVSGLKYLCDREFINLEKINTFVGTSIGAIISFLLMIGYSPDELIVFFSNYDFKNLEPDFSIDSIINNYGMDDGNSIIELLKFFFEKKYKLKNITMKELFILTKKNFIINSTNLNTEEEKILSHETTPELCVFTAIRMSISIPIIYTPVLYNNEHYGDGAISNSILLNKCNPETTLGFFIDTRITIPSPITSIKDIILKSIRILSNRYIPKYEDIKIINFSCVDTAVIALNLTKEQIDNIFNRGIICTKLFINNEKNQLKLNIIKLKKENKYKVNNIINDILNNIITEICSQATERIEI